MRYLIVLIVVLLLVSGCTHPIESESIFFGINPNGLTIHSDGSYEVIINNATGIIFELKSSNVIIPRFYLGQDYIIEVEVKG